MIEKGFVMSEEKFSELRKDFEKFVAKSYVATMNRRFATMVHQREVRERHLCETNTKYTPGSIHDSSMRRHNRVVLGIHRFMVIGRYYTQNGGFRNMKVRVYVIEGGESVIGKVYSINI